MKKHLHPRSFPRTAALILAGSIAVLLAGPAALAQSGTWAVDADGNWGTSGNWSGGAVADGVGFTASFTNNITATRTVTLDSARTIGNLTFSDSGVAGSSWVLSGPNTLTLDRTSGTPTITATTNATVSTVLAGNDGLAKSGLGLLVLTAANNYSGTTTINSGGALRATDGIGLPSLSNLTMNAIGSRAHLETSGDFTRLLGTGAGQIQWTGGGGFSAAGGPLTVRLNNGSTLTWAGGSFVPTGRILYLNSQTGDNVVDFQNAIDLAASSRTVSVDDNTSSSTDYAQISGVISNGTLVKSALGTLVLTGANSYGNTTISGGVLQIGNGGTTGTLGTGSVSVGSSSTLSFNRSDALSITNTILVGTTTSSIAQNGTGTTTLSGDMSSYAGNVQVNRGTLVLDYATNQFSKVGDAAVLTIGSAALQLAGGTLQEVVGSTTINGAASISRSSGTATLRLNAITIASGASLDLSLGSLADTDTFNTNGVLPGITVNGNLAKNGGADGLSPASLDGKIVALVAADYTDVPRIGGVVGDGAGTNVRIVNGGIAGNVTVAPAVTTTVNTLSQGASDGAAVVDIGALGTLRLGATGSVVVPAGSNALTFNGGTLTAGGADNTAGSLLFQNAASDVTVNSAIADNGTGAVGVSKRGAGILTLTGANLYTGATTVSNGKLVVNGSLAAGSAVSVASGATLGGSGQIDGNTLVLGTHAPGNSPGLQTFNGNLSYATNSTVNWELAANVSTDTTGLRGTHFDAVDVLNTGLFSIATGVTSSLIFNAAGSTVDFTGAFWTSNHSWLAYSDANAPALSSAAIFDTITVSPDSLGGTLTGGTFSWSQSGNDVVLNYTAVPEPGGAVLLTLGAGALLGWRRRRASV